MLPAPRVSTGLGGPVVQRLKVSSGGFGRALEDFTNTWSVKDQAITFLKGSPTFMKLAATLDSHYVWPFDPLFPRFPDIATSYEETNRKMFFDPAAQRPSDPLRWHVGPNGRVTQPAKAAGKRSIFFEQGGAPRFATFKTPGNPWAGDVMVVDTLDIATFIQSMAHEATHAAAFVGGSVSKAQTLVAEIEAGIQDEIRARKSEAKILGEIPNATVKAGIKLVGSREEWKVERDVSPGLNLTYMEAFFFSRQLRDAQAAEGLDDVRAARIRKEIDDLFGSVILKPSPGYGQTWFEWKTAVRDWEQFHKTHAPADASFEAEKEKLVQAHAKRFFKGKVSYRPVPTP